MTPSRSMIWKVAAGVLVLALVSWWLVYAIRTARPYRVESAALGEWTLVLGEPGGTVLAGLQPAAGLVPALIQQISERSGLALVPPARPLLPLVLQTEYEDSLQGVLSVDDVLTHARDAGIGSIAMTPVCIGRHDGTKGGRRGPMFFVLFEAPAFNDFRQRLTPLFPEHGGNNVFDPAALRPVLIVAVSDRDAARRPPAIADPLAECRTSVSLN
jgi:hypothetical protein